MGYRYKVDGYWRVKHDGTWKCDTKNPKFQDVEIFTDDVLSKQDDGRFCRHTGLGRFNITIPDEDVEFVKETANLEVM